MSCNCPPTQPAGLDWAPISLAACYLPWRSGAKLGNLNIFSAKRAYGTGTISGYRSDKDLPIAQSMPGAVGGPLQTSHPSETLSPTIFYDVPDRPNRPLIGREELLQTVKGDLVAGQDVALQSGLPGAGKTALAVYLATDPQILEHFKDGIVWVSLGRDPTVLPRLSARGIEVGVSRIELDGASSSDDLGRLIHRAIGLRRLLLVIDDAWDSEVAFRFRVGGPNCVHLLTTRFLEVADVFSEGNVKKVGELDHTDALELLERQAPTVVHDMPERAEECLRAAQGLPLAIILIGNYLRRASQGGKGMLDQALDKVLNAQERLRLDLQLPPSARPSLPPDVPATLFATIRLSDELLTEDAQRSLRQLTVFPPKGNTFSKEAANIVSDSNKALDDLWEHGLVEVMSSAQERYAIHQAILDYAAQGAENSDAYRRMALFFTGYIQHKIEVEPDKATWLQTLELEKDNLDVALQWAVDAQDARIALELAGALWRYWYERSHFAEGRRWIAKILSIPGSDAAELRKDKAKALNDSGNFAYNQADLKTAEILHLESLKLRKLIGAEPETAGSLNNLGLVARAQGNLDNADSLFAEALDISRAHKNEQWTAMHLNNLGISAKHRGELDKSIGLQQESLQIFQQKEDEWGMAMSQTDLAAAMLLQGRTSEARDLLLTSSGIRRRIQDTRGIATSLKALAELTRKKHEEPSAGDLYRAALSLSMDLGDKGGIADCLEGLAGVARDEERPWEGAPYLGAADGFRKDSGFILSSGAPSDTDAIWAWHRQALGPDDFEKAKGQGETAPLEGIAREALDDATPSADELIAIFESKEPM